MFDQRTRRETVVVTNVAPFVSSPPRSGTHRVEFVRANGQLGEFPVVLGDLAGWPPAAGDELEALYGEASYGEACLAVARADRQVWPSLGL